MRVLALCILEQDNRHTGLYGIHPFRIKAMTELLKALSTDFEDADMPLRQVIVNTHSPRLVGNMLQWENDLNVSVWYAQMRTRISNIDDKKLKMNITKMIPVDKKSVIQMTLEFLELEKEKKLSLAMVSNNK